jgi:hypothetical protein
MSSDSKSDVANGVKPQITRITQIHEGKNGMAAQRKSSRSTL